MRGTISGLIKLNCAVGEQEEGETVLLGDNKNDLLIAENSIKGEDIIRNFQFKLRKIMKAINNRRKTEERLIVL